MSKYKAKPVTLDGHRFASQAEAARYGELKLLERAGKIADLTVHPRFQITVSGHKICIYEADFWYTDLEQARNCVEDVKGFLTPAYRLKKKLMLAVHGIEIVEIAAATLRSPRRSRR